MITRSMPGPVKFARKALWFISLLLIVSIMTSCATTKVFPDAEWARIAEPESVGFSAEGLEALRDHLADLPSTGCVIVVDGQIVFANGNIADTSYIASVRKSVLAMLYGNYVADGTINLDKTLADLTSPITADSATRKKKQRSPIC